MKKSERQASREVANSCANGSCCNGAKFFPRDAEDGGGDEDEHDCSDGEHDVPIAAITPE